MGFLPSGGSGSGSGALTLLSTTSLSSPGSIDVTGISQSFNDLIGALIVRGTNAAINDQWQFTLNNDSGNNYFAEKADVSTTTPTLGGGQQLAAVAAVQGRIPAASGTAGRFGMFEFVIPGYTSTTWHKVLHYIGFSSYDTGTSDQQDTWGGACWASTAAVTRITIVGAATSNLATGSVLRLYGRL